ncbi:hypothetical protein [Curtobacterium sp. BH-2-1-1]|uniref:hypothetical protein n=1 Tax=Curtobacterium sp. BH-2-1-1 TaxID=1905847 RepID=UPI0011A92B7F|nr:hypothetical protein [Curtobacterium sp. BH-2-1-1]
MRTTTSRGRSLLVVAAAVGVCAAAVGGVEIANADTGTPSSSASAAAGSAAHRLTTVERTDLRRIEHALPTSLRTALRAAEHHRTKAERHDALATVERGVTAGTYGTTAKTLLRDVQQDGTGAWPAAVAVAKRITAVEAGKRAPVDRELRTFLRRAIDGRYGSTLQQQLESLGSSLPAVTRSGSGSASGTASGSASVS